MPATNLTRGEAVYLPIHWFYLIEEYNGPAAGNCLEEAVLQALGEVVERHVGSVISYERRPTPVIDPESVTDPVARELLEKFRRNGIVVHLRDFSLDTGIPTVAALAYDPSTFPADSEIVFAAGTTTDPTKSLIRALTEVAQLAGDFHRRTSYRPTLPKYETLEEAAYLMAPGPVVPLDSLPNLSRPNLKDEIRLCLEALSRLGLEVLVVNVTHPALNLPVVYVLIPGTHFLDRTRNTNVIFHLAKTAALYAPPLEALAALAELNAAFPARFDVHFFLGLALENQDRAGEALEHFRQALELNPPAVELPSIYVHLGTCQKDLGYLKRPPSPSPGPWNWTPTSRRPTTSWVFAASSWRIISRRWPASRRSSNWTRARPSTTPTWGSIYKGWGTARRRRSCSNRPWNWTRPWTSPPGPWLHWRTSWPLGGKGIGAFACGYCTAITHLSPRNSSHDPPGDRSGAPGPAAGPACKVAGPEVH